MIQAICRWRSEAPLKLYWRLNPDAYMDWVAAAASFDATKVNASQLPILDGDAVALATRAAAA